MVMSEGTEEVDLEERISELREEFGNLLDDQTLERIALDEMGKLERNKRSISELSDRKEATIDVEVAHIYDIKEFTKKDGSGGRVRNLLVEDDTDSCRLVLWDDEVEIPEKLELQPGDRLKLVNCYVKFTEYGIDVSKGKFGHIEKL